MKKFRSIISVSLMVVMVLSLFTGCKKDAAEGENVETNAKEDLGLTVETEIHYSAGDSKEWAYGNQQKEFSGDENCYVRINSIAIADKKAGVDAEISVTYRFTCKGEFHIELSDGIAKEVATGEDGIIEYTRTLVATKKKDVKDDIVIFQYAPSSEGSITLEVIYDDNISERQDQRNTVYFSGLPADIENGIH